MSADAVASTKPVRLRFAPSPTGYFHVGGARTALWDWLYVRRMGGRFILRVEDTDRTRYDPQSVPDLLEALRWLGLCWDEGPEVGGAFGPYYQSDRLPLYHQYAEQLVAEGKAYRCYCSPQRLEQVREAQRQAKQSVGYDRHCRTLTRQQIADYEAQGIRPVIRLAVPLEGSTVFTDLVRGRVEFDNRQVDDPVMLKSDGFPTYHLAVVVDDHLMEISHITRGEEWISSAPQHVLLYQALGWEMPITVHLPTILDPSGHGKLSKRKKKDASGQENLTFVYEFRQAGYLPEAMVNFLALVGWSYDGQRELFSREELVRAFDLVNISHSAAAFSYDKLDYMNGVYIRELGHNDLAGRLVLALRKAGLAADFDAVLRLVPLVRERLKTLNDIVGLVDFVFQPTLSYDAALLVQKGMDRAAALTALQAAAATLRALPAFDEASMEPALRAAAERLGLKAGQFFGCLRVACSGRTVSPPLLGIMEVLGRERVLQRVEEAQLALG
jgi:glutamyl-tRNA synthetase